MPSIFARSRTGSTPKSSSKHTNNAAVPAVPPKDLPDEFGRVTSRGSTINSPLSKREKKKEAKAAARQRTQSSPHEPIEAPSIPDGSFLPFSWPPEDIPEEPRQKLQTYGYMSYQCEVVLGLEEVTRLVEVVSSELSQRGLTTPLLFSSKAIDISPSRIKRLIDTFLRTCSNFRPGSSTDLKWREEAQFSGPHELAMMLRWGLARIVRIFQGHDARGILSWESYLRWREDEASALYPPEYFEAFLPPLPMEVQVLLTTLLAFLARLTAHATSSGLTPPALSSLFGPLLFGLGSAALPFHHTYGAYLRCSHATEHILLAYIRTQDAATHRAISMPSRLKDWIRGYPAMIPPIDKLDKARRGARTVRVTSARRNVRLYSHDLVKTAASWTLVGSKEWTRVVGPPHAKLVPRYSDAFRKRLDMPPSFVPDVGFDGNHSQSSSTMSSGSSTGDEFGLLGKEDEKRFRSLTDLKWGEFESSGFGGGDDKRLEFDLNEGARTARNEKRSTLSWNDFSASGFSRSDAPLSATLQFATPITTTISAWPTRQSEIQHKLKKTQKALPAFGWDTNPVLVGEEAIEEGFLDAFCDLLYGSGWVDRGEQTFRDCNWALVEYKSMPQSRPSGPLPPDPRTGASLWLYEEFVPFEYRSQLTAPKRKLPISMFGMNKGWKPATTLNGRPYVVGGVPRVPNPREVEFEGLLNGGNITKVISLGVKTDSHVDGLPPVSAAATARAGAISSPLFTPLSSISATTPASPTTVKSVAPTTPSSRRSRFLPGGSMRKRSPAEYDALDFETRTMFANLSDEELGSGPHDDDKDPRRSKSSMGHVRKESKDDAWVDILVGAQRRLNDQSAEMRPAGVTRRPIKRRSLSDPELQHAREEIAQALKDAGPVPSEADDDKPVSRDHTQEHAEESQSDEELYGPPEDKTRDSIDSTDFEPMPHMRAPSQDDPRTLPSNTPLTHSRSESTLLPPNLQLNAPAAHIAPATGDAASPPPPPPPPKPPGKGVSSLIEMYREREKESMSPAPSRLPVRTASLTPVSAKPQPQPQAQPPLSPQPQAQLEPPAPVSPPEEDPFVGRVSPGAPRYVHGAPLHNVVEAPEEEEEEA
ncbi:hypothetical protein K439DRAFT_1364585 [Ramaria rubella]|nr:hypothetical protein K439DRAFT_1364585 [Ramaria rubella]